MRERLLVVLLLLLLLLLLLAGLAWWLWPRPAPAPSTPPAPAPLVPTPLPPSPAPSAPAVTRKAPEEPFVPEGPEQEALAALAGTLGGGIIRCNVPEDPALVSAPFPRSTWEGRTLVALVEDPDGVVPVLGPPPVRPENLRTKEDFEAFTAAIVDASRARFTISWGEAWPGEVGWCDVDEPRRVRISGRITMPDGSEPTEEVWLNGCASGGSVFPDASGAFSFETDAGPPCTLEVRSTGMPGGTVVERSTDRDDIVVVWRERDAGMVEVLEAKAREAREKAAYERDVLQAALDQVDSVEARQVLRDWQEARAAGFDAEADMTEDMVETWEKQALDE